MRRSVINQAAMLLFGVAGFIAHSMYLLVESGEAKLPPLLSSTRDWLLVLAWIAILFYLFLTMIDRELAIGLFLLPLVLFLIGSAYFVRDGKIALVSEKTHGWSMLHAALLVFGIAGVIVGFVMSMMYLAQHYRLKRKQTMQDGLALPSLEKLARWNWWAVMISVPLLSLGMLTGVRLVFLLEGIPKPPTFTDPIVVVNGFVWLIMAAFFVWLLKTRRPAGKQVAWLTVLAFGFLLVTVIGLQVLTHGSLDTFHTQLAGSVFRLTA